MNTSCGDTVKCLLDASKSPIFRSQSPCTDISVRKSQRVTVFVWIYPYKSLKGLKPCFKLFDLRDLLCVSQCPLSSFAYCTAMKIVVDVFTVSDAE